MRCVYMCAVSLAQSDGAVLQPGLEPAQAVAVGVPGRQHSFQDALRRRHLRQRRRALLLQLPHLLTDVGVVCGWDDARVKGRRRRTPLLPLHGRPGLTESRFAGVLLRGLLQVVKGQLQPSGKVQHLWSRACSRREKTAEHTPEESSAGALTCHSCRSTLTASGET